MMGMKMRMTLLVAYATCGLILILMDFWLFWDLPLLNLNAVDFTPYYDYDYAYDLTKPCRPPLQWDIDVIGVIEVMRRSSRSKVSVSSPTSTEQPDGDGDSDSDTKPPATVTGPGFRVRRKKYDVCIVGAGLSGAVIAEQHASQLGMTSLVLEKRNHIGGNCYDYVDPDTGLLVNKYGAHLFHTKDPRVWRYLQQFSEWTPFEHRVMAWVNETYIPVPVNIDTVNALFGLCIVSTKEMDKWLSTEQTHYGQGQGHEPVNSEEMALSRVGSRLFKLIFEPYTEKHWAKHPRQLGPQVTARIPVQQQVRNNWDERYFGDDVFQALPTKGYTALFERMLQHPLIDTYTNVDYFAVRDSLKCSKTYYTGPIDVYFASLGWEKLEYRSLDFERLVVPNTPEFLLPTAVVNYPSLDYNFTRIVEYKHFLMQKSPHTVLFLEHSKDSGEPYYPVPNDKNKALFARYKALADKEPNVTFVGRLANYKYFNMDESVKNALNVFDDNAPRVVVLLYLMTVTGGPEALVQLASAFYSWMPSRTFHVLKDGLNSTLEHYARIYPELESMKRVEMDFLRPGDVYIIPEEDPCPVELIHRGVHVFVWLLGQTSDERIVNYRAAGCRFLSHSFWLSNVVGLTRKETLLPYVGAWAKREGPVVNSDRRNVILVNTHDDSSDYESAIERYCRREGCKAIKPRGLNRDGLLRLYRQAKIVFASCMRGSERMVLESVLQGAVLVTDDCWEGTDLRDFPIPRQNKVTNETISSTIHRILNNFIEEQRAYEGIRSLYHNLGPKSLAEDTARFMHEVVKPLYLG